MVDIVYELKEELELGIGPSRDALLKKIREQSDKKGKL